MFGFGKKKNDKNSEYKVFKNGLKLHKDTNISDDGTNLIFTTISGMVKVPKRAIQYAMVDSSFGNMIQSTVVIHGNGTILGELKFPHKQAQKVMDYINQNFPANSNE